MRAMQAIFFFGGDTFFLPSNLDFSDEMESVFGREPDDPPDCFVLACFLVTGVRTAEGRVFGTGRLVTPRRPFVLLVPSVLFTPAFFSARGALVPTPRGLLVAGILTVLPPAFGRLTCVDLGARGTAGARR